MHDSVSNGRIGAVLRAIARFDDDRHLAAPFARALVGLLRFACVALAFANEPLDVRAERDALVGLARVVAIALAVHVVAEGAAEDAFLHFADL